MEQRRRVDRRASGFVLVAKGRPMRRLGIANLHVGSQYTPSSRRNSASMTSLTKGIGQYLRP